MKERKKERKCINGEGNDEQERRKVAWNEKQRERGVAKV